MRLFVLSPDSCTDGPRLQVGGSDWLSWNNTSNWEAMASTSPVFHIHGEKTPSAFNPALSVSDRTAPSLSTVILQRPVCRKIWVDAFCVPGPEQPAEREAPLQSMSFMCSQAEEVVMALTAQARPALERITSESSLLRTHLSLLEQEDWVTRAWTYQEAVNSKWLIISCHEAPAGILIKPLSRPIHILEKDKVNVQDAAQWHFPVHWYNMGVPVAIC